MIGMYARPAIVCLLVAVLTSALSAEPAASRPASAPALDYPEPDPANPVDYIELINATFGRGIQANAAEVYRKAFDRIEPFAGEWDNTTRKPWTDNPEVLAWLEANREGLRLFRQAAEMEECFFKLDSAAGRTAEEVDEVHPRARNMLLRVLLPDVSDFRSATRGLMAAGYRQAAERDYQLLERNALTVLRAGRHLDGDAVLVRRFVGFAVSSYGYDGLFAVLSARTDPDVARRLAGQLRRLDPPHPSLARQILCERLTQLDFHQRLFKPLDNGDHWTLVPEVAEGFGHLFSLDNRYIQFRVLAFGYEATIEKVNQYYDRVDAWFATPDHKVDLHADLRDDFLKDNTNILLTLLPSYDRSRLMLTRMEATRRALHLVLLLLSHDEAPLSLDELRDERLADVRIDPYSGRDFVYTRTDDGFRLYSVAHDRTDNGGRHDPRWGEFEPRDFVFWPVQRP